jgi:hypothetical protein
MSECLTLEAMEMLVRKRLRSFDKSVLKRQGQSPQEAVMLVGLKLQYRGARLCLRDIRQEMAAGHIYPSASLADDVDLLVRIWDLCQLPPLPKI